MRLPKLVTSVAIAGLLGLSACDDANRPEATTQPRASEATPTAAAKNMADCILGDWYVDNDEFMQMINGAGGSETITKVSGAVKVTFDADQTMKTVYEDWTHEIESAGRTLVTSQRGTDAGTYRLVGEDGLEGVDTEIESVTTTTNEDGTSNETRPVAGSSMLSSVTVECSANELQLVSDGNKLTMTRTRQ